MFHFLSPYPKKKERDKTNNIIPVSITYFIKSSLFWIFLSLIFFFNLYDPTYGINEKLKLTSSSSLFVEAILVFGMTLIFSCFIGILLSLPAIFVKFTFIYKLRSRKQRGQKPVILMFFTKYIPLIILYSANILFFLFNLSISPEVICHIFEKNNMLVSISKSMHKVFFHNKKHFDFYEFGKMVGNKYPQTKAFYFFIPGKILDDNNQYLKTKIILPNQSKILITNGYKSDTLSSIFQFYPSTNFKLYSKIPFKFIENSKNFDNNFIGIDIQNLYQFYSLFNSFADLEKIHLSWFDVFMNKFCFTQPQLFYFFKSGYAEKINSFWSWGNMYTSNEELIKKYTNFLLNSKNTNLNNFSYFLTGLDPVSKHSLLKAFSIQKENDFQYNNELKTDDLNLAQYIGGLQAAHVKNIYLIPYNEINEGVTIRNYYSSTSLKNTISVYENMYSPENLDKSKAKCYLKTSDQNNANLNENLVHTLAKNSTPITIDDKYELYVNKKISQIFVCFLDDESIFYFTKEKEDYKIENFTYNQNFSKLFQTYSESKTYLRKETIKTKINIAKNEELFENEFFSQFKIFKVDQTNKTTIIPFQNSSEKEPFYRKYARDIINEMYKESNK